LTTFNPKVYLDKFRKAIKKPFFDLSQYETKLNEIINHYYDDTKICLNHNDLTAGNFLYLKTGELKLIDYEYSMLNHYLFDYGSFLTETLNGQEEDTFIELLNLSNKELLQLKSIMFYQLIL
jgi:thiamine kinase-like enzyme